jgi:hypothetical protein
VTQLEAGLEASWNVCTVCHKTANIKVTLCCSALICRGCIANLTKENKGCPTCREVLQKKYHGLTDAYKLYKKMSTIVNDQAAIATANSSR